MVVQGPTPALDPAEPAPSSSASRRSPPTAPSTRHGIRRHLRRMAAAGVGVYLGGGGSGEGYVLAPEEARRLLAIGVEELKGKVPVRVDGHRATVGR